MTFILKLYPDMVKMYLHTKNEVSMSVWVDLQLSHRMRVYVMYKEQYFFFKLLSLKFITKKSWVI